MKKTYTLQYWCATCGRNTTASTLCAEHPDSDQFELEVEDCRNCKHFAKRNGTPCPDHINAAEVQS